MFFFVSWGKMYMLNILNNELIQLLLTFAANSISSQFQVNWKQVCIDCDLTRTINMKIDVFAIINNLHALSKMSTIWFIKQMFTINISHFPWDIYYGLYIYIYILRIFDRQDYSK